MKLRFFLFLVFIQLVGCDVYKEYSEGEEIYSLLKNNLIIGSVTPARDILKKTGGIACLLPPYQDRVIDPRYSININKLINEKEYIADEGRWALIYYSKDGGRIFVFNRSRELDVVGGMVRDEDVRSKFPKEFVPSECMEVDVGVFAKANKTNRNFIMIGEMK